MNFYIAIAAFFDVVAVVAGAGAIIFLAIAIKNKIDRS